MGNLGRLALVIGIAASAGAAGCFLAKEDVGSTNDEVNAGGDVSNVLKSTLVVDGSGCTAAKVGPRHLLIAARCVSGKPAFETGKVITFKAVSELRTAAASGDGETVLDAGAPKKDANADATSTADASAPRTDAGRTDGGADAGTTGTTTNRNNREATIAEVKIHASYTAKCTGELCAFGAIGASDAKDVAVIILEADLDSVPTIPVDLDSVGTADSLLAIGSGCTKFDGTPTGGTKTVKTLAVPAKSVNHVGSPYVEQPALTTRLGGAYVVTPGIGWFEEEPEICKNDIGAPLFRGSVAAVAGVTSNYTTYTGKNTPVTIHHTRVDTASKVGAWLETLGVETTHSCSESTAGCVKHEFDGGIPSPVKVDGTTSEPVDSGVLGDAKAPKGDAGQASEEEDAGAPSTELPSQGTEGSLPATEEEGPRGSSSSSDSDDYDAGPKKKKKKDEGGCSAAPGSTPNNGGMLLGFGLVIAAAAARRRRASK